MATRRVIIKASDVAACIGRHQYKAREEVMNEIWKKTWPETFKGQTRTDRAREILQISPEARKVLDKAVEIKAKNSSEVQSVFEKAKEAINSDSKLNASQKAEVLEHVRSQVYTTHGTRSEDKTSDKVSVTENTRLTRDDAFYNIDVCTIGDVRFVVCGKIDRIEERDDGSRILVEIKNRTNRLFRRVVEYEFIQVQVYLQMLGLVHARLVEQYNNQVLSHDVNRDEETWTNEILPGLATFCEELYTSANA
jgi:hypothetical protein